MVNLRKGDLSMRNPPPQQRSLTLTDLLFLVDEGAIALPEFQRQYRWGDAEVRSLLATVLLGWPAGLLLLMEAPTDQFFAMRPIEGGPDLNVTEVRHLILDGQQRITALYEAFRPDRPSEPRGVWTLDIELYNRHTTVEELEEALIKAPVQPRGQETSGRYKKVLNRVPLSVLRSRRSFFDWRDELSFSSALMSDASALYADINDLWSKSLAQVTEYRFPSVILSRSMPLASVAKIFERLNSSGMVLDTFDLVVAHVYRDGRNLRSAWDTAVAERPALKLFARDDALLAVEVIALRRRGDTRRSSLLSLDAADLWNFWRDVVDALDRAASFLINEAGVPSRERLPHRAIHLVLGALAVDLDLMHHKTALLYWVFASALESRFDAAVNTRVVSEYRGLSNGLLEGRQPREVTTTLEDLASATRRGSSSVWFGVQAMIRTNGIVDLPLGLFTLPIDQERSRAFSITRQVSKITRASDPALSILLLSQTSGSLVEGRGAPALFEFLRSLDREMIRNFAASQLLPQLRRENYATDQAFLISRARVVRQHLSKLHAQIPIHERPHHDGDSEVGDSGLAAKIKIAKTQLAADMPSEAVRLLREVLLESHEIFGSDHPETLRSTRDLAEALQLSGRPVEASALLTENLTKSQTVLGVDHPDTLHTKRMLADSLISAGRLAEAILTLEDYVTSCNRLLGLDNRETLVAQSDLARAYLLVERHEEALDLLQRSASKAKSLLGEAHSDTLNILINLANACASTGDADRAIRLLERVISVRRNVLGDDHSLTVAVREELAAVKARK